MVRGVTRIVLLLLAAGAGAQNLPSVDIETANMQIQQFEQENRSLESRISLLTESVTRLESEAELWNEWVDAIERVSARLEREADQLIEVLGGIGSRSIVERAQSTLERYSRIASLIEAKHEELADRIAEGRDLIEMHRGNVTIYRSRIEQNRNNISLLEAAIAKSQSSESLIETYLDDLDAVLDDAAGLLVEPSRETE